MATATVSVSRDDMPATQSQLACECCGAPGADQQVPLNADVYCARCAEKRRQADRDMMIPVEVTIDGAYADDIRDSAWRGVQTFADPLKGAIDDIDVAEKLCAGEQMRAEIEFATSLQKQELQDDGTLRVRGPWILVVRAVQDSRDYFASEAAESAQNGRDLARARKMIDAASTFERLWEQLDEMEPETDPEAS